MNPHTYNDDTDENTFNVHNDGEWTFWEIMVAATCVFVLFVPVGFFAAKAIDSATRKSRRHR